MSVRHLRCAGSSPVQCAKNPHCAWQLSDPPACVLDLDRVGHWLDSVCSPNSNDQDTTVLLDALMTDLKAFGIEIREDKSTRNPCRRAVVGLLTHFLLRNEAIDRESVQEVIRKWSGRLLPGFALRPFGYRQTLQDLLDDVDTFTGRLMSDLADRGELALPSRILSEGQIDIRRSVGRYGSSRTGKLLAAGGLLALLVMLASSHGPSSPDPEVPISPAEERMATVIDSFPEDTVHEEEVAVDRLPTLDELIDSLPDTDIESLVLASELPIVSFDRPRDLEFKEIALGAAGLAGAWKLAERIRRQKNSGSSGSIISSAEREGIERNEITEKDLNNWWKLQPLKRQILSHTLFAQPDTDESMALKKVERAKIETEVRQWKRGQRRWNKK